MRISYNVKKILKYIFRQNRSAAPALSGLGIAKRHEFFLDSAMRDPISPSSARAQQLSIQERTVLNLIETGLATSQVELVARCNLSPTTVSGIVNRLVVKSVIRPIASPTSDTATGRQRGRPQMHFEVPRQRALVLITLGGSILQAQAFHRGQAVSDPEEFSFHPSIDSATVIKKIAELHRRTATRLPRGHCDYLALTTDGYLDGKGIMHTHPFKPWMHGMSIEDLGATLKSQCQTPIFITTSSHAPMILGEFRALRSDGVTRICELVIGDGVSSAMVDLTGFWGTASHYRGDVANLVFRDEKNPFGGSGPPNFEDLTCGFGLLKWMEQRLPHHPNSPLARMLTRPPAASYALIEELHQARSDSLAVELGERFLRLTAEALRILNTILEPGVFILNGYALRDRAYWKQRLTDQVRDQLAPTRTVMARIMFSNLSKEETLREITQAMVEPDKKAFKAASGILVSGLPASFTE